jgi:hypothetical protein
MIAAKYDSRINMLNLDNFITCGNSCRRANRRRDRAVFRVRKLNGVGNGLFQNGSPAHDMVDMKSRKFSRMVIDPRARHLDVVGPYVLTFFLKDRYDIGGGAGRNRDQKQL